MSYYDDRTHGYGIREVLDECGVQVKREEHGRLIYFCPFCGEQKGKGDASLEKDVFFCYKCSTGGYLFEMYARLNEISNREAKRRLEEKYDSGERRDDRKQRTVQHPAQQIQEPQNAATDEVLHAAYSSYLEMLELDTVHEENLERRGLSEEFIRSRGYKSVPVVGASYYAQRMVSEGINLQGVSGFYREDDCYKVKVGRTGFYIPTRNMYGQIVGMQVRSDNPKMRYYSFSSSNKPGGASMASQMHFVGVDVSQPVKGLYLTEGALKADVAHFLSGRPFVSIPGVGNFRALRQGLGAMRKRNDIFGEARIILATDMDETTNPFVEKNVEKLREVLTEYGFPVQKMTWDPAFKGIDDYLLGKKRRKFDESQAAQAGT